MSDRGTEEPQSDEAAQDSAPKGYSSPPNSPRVEVLEKSIEEAEILVSFIAHKGTPAPDTEIQTIVAAAEQWRAGAWNVEKEVSFWTAFRALSEQVYPVTIESIQATMPRGVRRPEAARSVTRYAWSTISVLIIALVCQVYWVIGSDLTGNIKQFQTELQQLKSERASVKGRIDTLGYERGPLIRQLTNERSILRILPEGEKRKKLNEKVVGLQTRLEKNIDTLRAEREKLTLLDAKIPRLEKASAANLDILSGWAYIFRGSQSDQGETSISQPNEAEQTNTPKEIFTKAGEKTLALGSLVLNGMSSYLLPMLYGLLGALAYILRSLATEIRLVTFSTESKIRYRLRWPLGMLAGIAVAWFVNPSESEDPLSFLSGLAALRPLALAFVAGYSVELFFTSLDRAFGEAAQPGSVAKGAGE